MASLTIVSLPSSSAATTATTAIIIIISSSVVAVLLPLYSRPALVVIVCQPGRPECVNLQSNRIGLHEQARASRCLSDYTRVCLFVPCVSVL